MKLASRQQYSYIHLKKSYRSNCQRESIVAIVLSHLVWEKLTYRVRVPMEESCI
jgi:hypothetical protein